MNFIFDMNISPSWIGVFEAHGHEATHWSQIGSYSATDKEILEWARENQSVVFTNDLDFGAIIAATGAAYPSVIQLRDLDITPGRNVEILMNAIKNYPIPTYQLELRSRLDHEENYKMDNGVFVGGIGAIPLSKRDVLPVLADERSRLEDVNRAFIFAIVNDHI